MGCRRLDGRTGIHPPISASATSSGAWKASMKHAQCALGLHLRLKERAATVERTMIGTATPIDGCRCHLLFRPRREGQVDELSFSDSESSPRVWVIGSRRCRR